MLWPVFLHLFLNMMTRLHRVEGLLSTTRNLHTRKPNTHTTYHKHHITHMQLSFVFTYTHTNNSESVFVAASARARRRAPRRDANTGRHSTDCKQHQQQTHTKHNSRTRTYNQTSQPQLAANAPEKAVRDHTEIVRFRLQKANVQV